MREIKFRGLDKFGIWHYGLPSYGTNNQIAEIEVKCCGEFVEVIPETIGQYTGLKDKHNTKIYEGDIVQAYNGINKIIGVVKFGEYKQDGSGGEYNSITCTGFYVERIKTIPNAWEVEDDLLDFLYEPDYEKTTSLQRYKYVEVIGNIYDNPELLGNIQYIRE